jgi:hypothetical protein
MQNIYKICNVRLVWYYSWFNMIVYWYSTSVQVRKLQCIGMAFRGLHMENVAYMYVTTWHTNTETDFDINISWPDWFQQKFN